MTNLAAFSSQLPAGADFMARKQRDAERKATEQAAARSLEASQIGAGGLLVTDGGSITIEGTGSLHVGSGALDSAGSISADDDITAGGALNANSLAIIAAATIGGGLTAASIGATGNMDASGRVFSAGALVSPGSHDYNVSVGYVAAWINGDGTIGTSPSTEALKKDLAPMNGPTGILDLQPYWGHYDWDDSTERPKSFLIAEKVYDAGFGPDIAPLDADGKPFTVNYSQLVPALIAELQAAVARIAALEAKS